MFGFPIEKGRGWGIFPALVLCRENDFPLTKAGLIYIAKKHNIGIKDNKHWKINERALMEYIKSSKENPPPDWITVNTASIEYHISKYRVYNWIHLEVIAHEYFGHGKGILYVSGSDVRKRIEEYKEKYNEEKGN